jgi:hypothetical protein
MNIVVGPRGRPKKCNVPDSSQDEANNDNASVKFWHSEKLTGRQQVHDARKRQRRHEVGATSVAEVA